LKVSLIATVLNAAEHVPAFLESMRAQTRTPDEIVIVDGGSTDGTAEHLSEADGITLVREPGANIARGRNVAIAHSSHEVIAVADADCEYGPEWLASLLEPIESGADVAMGVYEPIVGSFFEACVASVNLPLDPADVDEGAFMPSARSVAFRREAIEAVGGYPEWLAIGEDMWVNHRWRERGFQMRLAPGAVAGWHPRPSLRPTLVQYFKYARGDAQAGMYPERHALRFAVYGGLVAALVSRRTWPRAVALAGGLAYARKPVARAWTRLQDPGERALATAVVPALMAAIDLAKMAGYAAGLAGRLTGGTNRLKAPSS
jgi:cellulose synthase/poly-beta-1,6-N-acetylglucosamine synthase-like glycosyltransferase